MKYINKVYASKKYMGCLKHTLKNNHIKMNIKLTFNILMLRKSRDEER